MLITSVNNNHIKELCRLKEKKYRDITGLFLCVLDNEHAPQEQKKRESKFQLVRDEFLLSFDFNITQFLTQKSHYFV